MRTTPPCLNCVDKTQGCHSECNKYKAYCLVLKAEKKAIQESKKREKEYVEYCVSVNARVKKHKRKKERG